MTRHKQLTVRSCGSTVHVFILYRVFKRSTVFKNQISKKSVMYQLYTHHAITPPCQSARHFSEPVPHLARKAVENDGAFIVWQQQDAAPSRR